MTDTPATLVRRAMDPARHRGCPRTVLVVMCAGYFLMLLGVTIVNVALPAIGSGPGTGVGGPGGTPSGGGWSTATRRPWPR
ncbi:hypothetical protein ABZX77_43325 [Streptomyces sp. NPDC004237]|uniref:hypothetical protein n=1 Tax=Streptomyces sp. NPDC004237 TaxID=3154455 RepID=UPI0033AF82D1